MGNLKNIFAPIMGVLALIGLALFIVYLLQLLTAEEREWSRAVYIFAAVEAVGFAAAGFFFGAEVHRERAENAENRADQAQIQVNQAEKQAVAVEEKGKALKIQIDAKAQSYSNRRSQAFGDFDPKQAASVAQSDVEELARIAKELFP